MTARLNAAFSDPPPFNPAESAHLGLYVAARLAQRHGIGITLRDSAYGGTTAIVLIPHGLIVSDGQHSNGQAPGTRSRAFAVSGQAGREPNLPGVALSGRHASRNTPRGVGIPSGTAASAAADAAPPRAHAPGSVSSPPSPAGIPARHAGTLAGAEFQLPRRIRQANLPPHLLKSATARHKADPKPTDDLSPEEIRAAFADIQDGMERGNREVLVPGGREAPRNGLRDPRGAGPAPWAPPASERSIGDNDR